MAAGVPTRRRTPRPVEVADEASAWHTHGERGAYGVVLDGELRLEWGPGGSQSATGGGGEFFHVPAGAVHRDVNPSTDEQDYVPWLTGSEPRTVPVDEPPEG